MRLPQKKLSKLVLSKLNLSAKLFGRLRLHIEETTLEAQLFKRYKNHSKGTLRKNWPRIEMTRSCCFFLENKRKWTRKINWAHFCIRKSENNCGLSEIDNLPNSRIPCQVTERWNSGQFQTIQGFCIEGSDEERNRSRMSLSAAAIQNESASAVSRLSTRSGSNTGMDDWLRSIQHRSHRSLWHRRRLIVTWRLSWTTVQTF